MGLGFHSRHLEGMARVICGTFNKPFKNTMSVFKPFEADTLRLIGTSALGASVIESIIAEAELVSYKHSGAGYFLTVRHPSLPENRIVCSKPVVTGKHGETVGGFLAFIENGELMLEC